MRKGQERGLVVTGYSDGGGGEDVEEESVVVVVIKGDGLVEKEMVDVG